MKITYENYNINSPKITKDYKICLISDLHFTNDCPFSLVKKLIVKITELKPDFLIITGDIINNTDNLLNKKNQAKIELLFGALIKKMPIYFILGNHDIFAGQKTKENDVLEYYTNLTRKYTGKNKLTFLNNNYAVFNKEIMIANFSPRWQTYFERYQDNWEDYYIKDFKKDNYTFNNKYFNIMAIHSPHTIYTDKVQNKLKDSLKYIDLYVAGHAHGGLIPKFLLKSGIIKSTKGICAGQEYRLFKKDQPPIFQVFPKCRGIHQVGNGKMVVSSGVRKFSAENILFRYIDKITAHDITVINLKREN